MLPLIKSLIISTPKGGFPKKRGPIFGSPYNKSPTTLGYILGPLIFGVSQIIVMVFNMETLSNAYLGDPYRRRRQVGTRPSPDPKTRERRKKSMNLTLRPCFQLFGVYCRATKHQLVLGPIYQQAPLSEASTRQSFVAVSINRGTFLWGVLIIRIIIGSMEIRPPLSVSLSPSLFISISLNITWFTGLGTISTRQRAPLLVAADAMRLVVFQNTLELHANVMPPSFGSCSTKQGALLKSLRD